MARNAAAGPPSTARWSKVRQAWSVGRTAMAPSPTTTGRSRMRPIQRMPVCGGLRIAVVMSTGWMPPFETVNVPSAISSGVSEPSRARAARSDDADVDLLEGEPVRADDDRGDEPLRRVDGDRDVDLREQFDVRLGHARVEERMLAEGLRDELHDDGRDPDPRRRTLRRSAARAARRAASRRARAPR